MHTEFYLEPTEADIREMKKALNSDETFLRFTDEEKTKLYSGMMNMKRVGELYDDVADSNETTKRTKYARKLQSSLERLIAVLNEKAGSAHLLQSMIKMRDTHGLTSQEVVDVVTGLEQTAVRLLQGSKQARPRKTNLPPPNRPPKALAEVRMMRDLLESLGISVGATGGETGSPATRLMVRIYEYVSGGAGINPDSIKDRLIRLKDWEANHQGGED